MKNKVKALNLLGLAMRARQVILGEELILKALRTSENALLLLATDCGNNIKKKVHNKANTYQAHLIEEFTTDELSRALGKNNRKLVLVTDKGFIEKFLEYMNS